jgi:hypothetical protein
MNSQVTLKFGGTCPAKSHLFMELVGRLLCSIFVLFLGTLETSFGNLDNEIWLMVFLQQISHKMSSRSQFRFKDKLIKVRIFFICYQVLPFKAEARLNNLTYKVEIVGLCVCSLIVRERIYRFAPNLACLFLETRKRIGRSKLRKKWYEFDSPRGRFL